MAEGRSALREIVWQEIFPWLILLKPLRLAISARVLVLSALGVLAMVVGWRLIGSLFQGTENAWLQQQLALQTAWPWDAFIGGDTGIFAGGPTSLGQLFSDSPIARVWLQITRPFRNLFAMQVSVSSLAYLVLCSLWAALVWGAVGGAITRIAALALARNEPAGLSVAAGYVRPKLFSYFLAPLMPLVGVALVMIPLAILGLFMRASVGVLLAAVLWPAVLAAGLLMTILLVGLLVGWPLMAATISVEGTDSFDALSRAYAYVYQRPLRLFLYTIVAALLGLLAAAAVDFFAQLIVHISSYAVAWGAGSANLLAVLNETQRETLTAPARGGAWLISLWHALVTVLQVAFRYAFFWCSAVAVYLLLRRSVDATEMDEVQLEAQEQQYGLPPLTTDAAGVPGAADVPTGEEG